MSCRSCCVECHFAYEETHAFPFLPEHEQARLIVAHRKLVAGGLDAQAVGRHARDEMQVFRQYVPPAILRRIEDDHEHHERGALEPRGAL